VKNEMGGECSTLGRDEKSIQTFGWQTQREVINARLRRRWDLVFAGFSIWTSGLLMRIRHQHSGTIKVVNFLAS
jgi:hypothetical protein